MFGIYASRQAKIAPVSPAQTRGRINIGGLSRVLCGTRTFSVTFGTGTDAGHSDALGIPAMPKDNENFAHGSRTLLGDGHGASENGGDGMKPNVLSGRSAKQTGGHS